uniref:Uncharacterized protein n=1 Tax=Enterobacter cloacae TaxID=550 RepID=A0A886QLW3_ENTCL|nr:hypothetical protein JJQ61_00235 [Enterobacter cloacae]
MAVVQPAPDSSISEVICTNLDYAQYGTVAKLAMRQPFVLFKGLTFQKNSAYQAHFAQGSP